MEQRQEPATLEQFEWDFDSDEIASIASEDLYRGRPNRWRGPASTWRTLTEEERLLWRSMKQLRNQDLAVHLYNAFALNRQGKNPETAEALTIQSKNDQPAVWKPSRQWTAWPLRWEHTPHPDFLGTRYRPDDGNDASTYQSKETQPSHDLEEALVAVILRQAKDRFLRRLNKHTVITSTEAATTNEFGPTSDGQSSHASSPTIPSSPPVTDAGGEAEHISNSGVDDSGTETERQQDEDRNNPEDPVIAADDDLSSKLLRPSVRHILSQLERTLRGLHQDRLLWEEINREINEDENDGRSPGKSNTQKSNEKATAGANPRPSHARHSTVVSHRNRHPEEGQSSPKRARHATTSKRSEKLPPSTAPMTDAEKDAAFERWVAEGDRKIASRQESLARSRASSENLAQQTLVQLMEPNKMKKRLAEAPPRDWKNIVRMAATAGFSPSVISRTAQRCADLFGEPLEVYNPASAPGRTTQAVVTEYQPRPVQVYVSDVESDFVSVPNIPRPSRGRLRKRARSSGSASSTRGRTSSRHSVRSSQPGSQASSEPGSPPPPAPPSPTKTGFWCPVPGCKRGREGFGRRANLLRHMDLVHSSKEVETKSEDELDGAVHVNGFMRPVHIRKRRQNAATSRGPAKRKQGRTEQVMDIEDETEAESDEEDADDEEDEEMESGEDGEEEEEEEEEGDVSEDESDGADSNEEDSDEEIMS